MADKNNQILDTVKVWLFPIIITILGTMLWAEIIEIKKDVKQLLAQSNIDKTKIEELQKDVKQLQDVIFFKKSTADGSVNSRLHAYAPWFTKLYFKPEEEFDVKKYLV